MSNRYLTILPANSNTTHSYKEGRPVIDFFIPEQEASLLPRSIRLCGRFHAFKDSTRGSTAGETRLSMDSRTGVWSVVDQVVISGGMSKTTIEHLKNANRFYSSYFSAVNDEKSLIGMYSTTGLTQPSTGGQQLSVIREGAGANSNEFCIHIPTGLLMGNSAINLSSQTGVGGIQLSIHLAPDSMVLYDANGSAQAGGYSGAFYELTDLQLVCEVSSEMVNAPLQYNSITSYYNTINSTNANVNFSLGLNRVSSTMVNFIPSDYLNNLDHNSLQTLNPLKKDGSIANVSQLVMTKGGMRYPLDYNIDTSFKDNSNAVQVDPQIIRNYMNSVLPFNKISHTLISPITCNKTYTSDTAGVLGGNIYGVGVAYDVLGSDGADFSQQSWGMQLDLDLSDNNPNSAFVFVHHKNTLVYNKGQVQVMA
jgi:hypothetical protein